MRETHGASLFHSCHWETDSNYQRFFRQVDRLWQDSAFPKRKPLSELPFHFHEDFKKELEAARVACFPLSRGCDNFCHWSQKQHTAMAWPTNVSNLKPKATSE